MLGHREPSDGLRRIELTTFSFHGLKCCRQASESVGLVSVEVAVDGDRHLLIGSAWLSIGLSHPATSVDHVLTGDVQQASFVSSSGALRGTRNTLYAFCMIMLSFRADEKDAAAAQRWADSLGIDRSELLREALRLHLNSLATEGDADRWETTPLDVGEQALAEIGDWGLAEDWSDWADAAR